MLNRTSPFRFVLTLLLALAVPFCCCDLRSLLSGCASCDTSTGGDTRTVAVHDDSEAHDTPATHSHCHGHSPKGDEQDGSTPAEAPEKDQHDCSCGKNTGKMLTVQKSTVELPVPVVIAVLAWAQPVDQVPLALIRGHERDQRVVQRPQTSLLRQHCALIV